MTRILLFGGSGQLGSALRRVLGPEHDVSAPASADVDLRHADALRSFLDRAPFDVVINAAAFTRVDDAETEREDAHALNETAPAIMAGAAQARGARFIHVSTDYVFDGDGRAPYGLQSPTSPLNVYGASKLAGEARVLSAYQRSVILRTAWVHAGGNGNFVATAVRVLTAGKTMRVVDDQIGTPTRAAHLATAISNLLSRPDVTGLLHFTDAGVASWFDVAACVLETLQERGIAGHVGIVPVPSTEYPRPARRPRVALLDKHGSWERIGWIPPHWRTGVRTSIQEILDA